MSNGKTALVLGATGGIGLDRLVAEEIQVDRGCDALAEDVDLLAGLLRREQRARHRAEPARLGQGPFVGLE